MFLTVTEEDGRASLALSGDWSLGRIGELDAVLSAARLPAAPLTLDGSRLQTLDTSAALALLLRVAAAGASIGGWVNLKPAHLRIIETVEAQAGVRASIAPRAWGIVAGTGYAAVAFARFVLAHIDFAGRAAAGLAGLARDPGRWRWKETIAQLQHVCLEAIPVVALVSALIGTVLAYLFGLQAEKYGASIFVVDAVAIGSARELAPLLVAVIVAGRSGAAFTAQLGTMRRRGNDGRHARFRAFARHLAGGLHRALALAACAASRLYRAREGRGVRRDDCAHWLPRGHDGGARRALDRPGHHLYRRALHRRGDRPRRLLRRLAAAVAPVNAIEADSIVTRINGRTLHDGVSFSVPRGKIVALIGASGVGKSVLMRELIGLARPAGGTIRVLGTDVWHAPEDELNALRRRFGMMFQDGALFSSLTVAQNVATPLVERGGVPPQLIEPLVQLRIAFAGLPPEAAGRLPSELSGGMRKRAAVARALALEPELLFLDEPTSGLDPVTARGFDKRVRFLSDELGLTVFLVTHDLDTLLGIVDRAIVLAGGKVVAEGTVDELRRNDDPWLRSYFNPHGT